MTLRRLPAFANETEEANWWYDNREKHAQEFVEAFAEGRVKTGGRARRLAEAQKAEDVRLKEGDARRAVLLADQKGLDVQEYLSELIHSALENELEGLLNESDRLAQSDTSPNQA
jgi:hypothetical protein